MLNKSVYLFLYLPITNCVFFSPYFFLLFMFPWSAYINIHIECHFKKKNHHHKWKYFHNFFFYILPFPDHIHAHILIQTLFFLPCPNFLSLLFCLCLLIIYFMFIYIPIFHKISFVRFSIHIKKNTLVCFSLTQNNSDFILGFPNWQINHKKIYKTTSPNKNLYSIPIHHPYPFKITYPTFENMYNQIQHTQNNFSLLSHYRMISYSQWIRHLDSRMPQVPSQI